MKSQGSICILCLERSGDFKAIDENTKDILDVFVPKINFTVIQEPVMCKNCEETLIKCHNFKEVCLHSYDYTISFLNNKNDVKLSLKDVYLSSNVTSTGVPEDQDIRGFCMGLVKKYSAVSLDVEEEGVMLEQLIKQCLPELDLSIIKNPVICVSCRGLLEDCFHFVMKCSIVGKKIKKYCETPDIRSEDQKELSSSLQLAVRDETSRKVDGASADVIKVEERFCGDIKNPDEREIGDGGVTVKLEQIFFDDSESVENKNISFIEMNNQEVNNEQQFTPNNLVASAGEINKLGSIKIEDNFCGENETEFKEQSLVEIGDQQFLINEEIEIKTEEHDFNRYEDGIVLPHSDTRRLHRKGMHHCKLCCFQTKHKYSLKNHLLVHKNPSEVTMYKCDSCLYQTKNRSNLKKHSLMHKDPSEVTMYKCDYCSHQTKDKRSLPIHLLKHKDPSEVTMYKCDFCLYQTKQKSVLKRHLLMHKDPSEVTMYSCHSCSYQTKCKHSLKRHLVIHKDPSEVAIHECHYCSFQTKRKNDLKKHLLKHKDPSEVTVYKCDSCSFRTILVHKYRNHLLTHKDPSEVTIYKCDSCSYQTDRKINLNGHLLVHKSPSEVTMYKCDCCPFQTKRKRSLKYHLLSHKDPSEITMYKCASCSYQTKRKDYIKSHMLNHKKFQK